MVHVFTYIVHVFPAGLLASTCMHMHAQCHVHTGIFCVGWGVGSIVARV